MKHNVDDQPRVPAGSDRGGEWTTGAHAGKTKQQKALDTHKPSTRAKREIASQSEHHVAAMLSGYRTPDNLPMDTIVIVSGKVHGIEVKTLMDNANDKITMHGESLARKLKWAHENKAELHTIVVDMRANPVKVYYRKGVGSFRLHTLVPVNDPNHLRELVGVK